MKVRRSAEALREALPSFNAAPLMFGHHEANVSNLDAHMAGYPVAATRMVSEGVVGGQYRLTSSEAIRAYREGRAVELSPEYDFRAVPAPDGAGYDFSMTDIVVDHIAQVPKGRNGPSIRLSEEDMSEVTISEDSAKSLGKIIVEGLKGLLGRSSEEGPEGGDKDKGKTRTREEQDAALAEVKALYADKERVQPLLLNEQARIRVREADTSLEVLGITLDLDEKEASEQGLDALRGRVAERLANKGRSTQGTGSWKGVNASSSESGAPASEQDALAKARSEFYANQGKTA